MGLTTFVPPVLEIFIVAAILSLVMTLAYIKLTDQAVMHEMKAEIARLKKKMGANRRDPEKLQAIQKEMMPLNMKYFKLSMKPTLYTLLPFLLIFMGLSSVYGEAVIIGPWSFSIPLIGNSLEWIGTYIIFSLVLTTMFRKGLKVA